MKTFTTYATKAKQILNLLQGYTKSIRLTAILILLLMGVNNVWGDNNVKVYCAIKASDLKCYTLKVNANIGDNNTWQQYTMEKLDETYEGRLIYQATIVEKYGGVDALQFQLYEGNDWKTQQQPYNTWTTSSTFANKLYVYDTNNWITKTKDASYTVYFVNKDSWSTIKAYAWNSDCDKNKDWSGADMTSTGKTYKGQNIYSITLNKRYANIIFNNGSSKTGDLTLGSTNIGKMYDGSNWVDYNVDPVVTFKANGGTSSDYTQTVKYNTSTALTANTFTRTGYSFNGWKTAANSGTSYADKANVTFKANTTLYAQWTAKDITINWDANGGSVNPPSSTYTYDGDAIPLPTPSYAGHRFLGWFTAANGGTQITDVGTTNKPYTTVTYYAHWEVSIVKHTVTFAVGTESTEYGTLTAATNSGNITSGSNIVEGTSVTFTATPNTGYEVEGWYTNAACTSGKHDAGSVIYETTVNDALNVYVKFVEKKWSVAFTAGTGGSVTTPSSTSQTVGQITGISIAATPTTGYTFKQWTITSGSGSFTSTATTNSNTFKPTDNATVTASFTETKHDITINGGTVYNSEETTASAGVVTKAKVTANAPIDGKKFTGWTLGTGITLASGYQLTDRTIEFTASQASEVTANYADRAQVKLYFAKPTDWDAVCAYTWKNSDTNVKNNDWPGVELTSTEVINCITYYTYQYYTEGDGIGGDATGNTAWDRVIFNNNNNGSQTNDLVLENGHYYYVTTEANSNGNESPITSAWYIKGRMNNWDESAPIELDCATNSGSVTISIEETDNYEFKLYDKVNNKWYSNSTDHGSSKPISSTMTSASKLYSNDENNMCIKVALEGSYVFTVSNTNETNPKLLVTFPEVYAIVGSFNDWNEETNPLEMSGNVGTASIAIAQSATNYTLKVLDDGSMYGKNSTTINGSTTIAGLSTSEANINLTADIYAETAPIYKFLYDKSNKQLTVTYPTAYTVTYGVGTNTGTESVTITPNIPSGSKVLASQSITFSKEETKTGYTWKNWNSKADGTGTNLGTGDTYTSTSRTGAISVYACYDLVNYTITYHTNGGNTIENGSYNITTATITLPAPTRTGYTFAGWYDNAELTGDAVTQIAQGSYGDKKLYAKWTANTYTITWNANGGTVDPTTSTYIYDGAPVDMPNPERTGCTFNGWFTEATGGERVSNVGKDNKPTSDVTYYAQWTIPAPTTDHTAVRVYEEQTINGWIAGDGAQATPYQFYNDETVRLTVTPLTEVAGLTAYYKVGETEQTANTFDLTNITTEVTPITITTYYKDSYGHKGTEATTTVYFQQVLTPQLLLITDPVKEISLEKVQAGTKVELTYSATYNGYTESVTIKENGNILATTSDTKKVFYRTPTDIGILTFTATTEEVAGRVFEVSTEVAVYKLVTIKVNDPQGLMNKVYLWRDATDAEDADIKTEWPGESFLQNFGTWHIFTVKYPYYTRFIVNDSKNFIGEDGKQTENYDIPNQDACYKLSDGKNGSGKYELTVTDCPGDLAVSKIDNITLTKGEQKIVVPSIQVSLGNKLSDVTATVSSADETKATAIMSGTNIIVYGHAEGTTTITVNYTLHGETVTKTFQVTVEKDTHITIQVKVPISFGDDAQYQWTNNDEIYIHYWGTGLNANDKKMNYLSADNTYKYLQAEIPLGTDDKTCFLVYYERIDSDHARWRQTDDVKDEYAANRDGCYLLHKNGVQNSYNRGIERTGDYCWEEADKYQVKIVMQNGKEYSSNIVTSTSDILSFFAPGKDEVNYRSGVVMLYKNDNLHTTIAPATFSESNVYTAQINDDGTGLTNVAVYTGNYYVRTYGNNDWGQRYYQEWTDDQRSQRKFTYFVPREGEFYNHYWIETLDYYDAGKDVSGWVANRYNNDLAGKLQNDKITDNNGKIYFGSGQTANVRFGYDPRTNYFGRAILKGSGENQDFLNVHCDNAFSDAACQTALPYGTSERANKFTDMSNWVYQSEFYVKIEGVNSKAKLYIDATAYKVDTKTPKDHLLGYEIDENDGSETDTPKQRTIMGSGTTNGIYHMVVIYDFKTNRLITAWKPEATNDVSTPTTVKSDVIFIRHENNDAPQINLSGQGRINELQTLYFALELERGSDNANDRHEEQYWFTLPFDCVVGEISGVPGYMETWGIQRYRGDLRAQKGWFLETPTFWEWLSPTDILKAGEGYLLAFDKKAASWAEYKDLDAGGVTRSILRLYFPSLKDTFNLQQATQDELTVTYPDHTCTITYKDRYKQDSNWKVIGTTSYNNATISSIVKDTDPNYNTWNDNDVPNFRYSYTYEFDSETNERTSYTYTPEDGKAATYKSFFSYMVQFAGTITWNPINKSVNPEGLAARRYVPEGERTSFTTRLELTNATGEKQDQTFVALDEKATTTFDQNKDLNKVMNSNKANIYTLSEDIPFAGNTLPMEKATVPVGVRIATAGEYTFRMPDGTDGITVTLVDNATGTHTNMLMDEYTVTLDAGTIENRFYLVVDPDRTATSVENIGEEAKGDKAKGVEKFLIDGKLFIRTADGIFDAKGQRL